jgi:hypothetical protein
MENLGNDVRYAWRMLIKSPGFAIVALLAPRLAIGANTAIFSLFNGVIWRPLPVKDPQQLVVVATQQRGLDFPIPLVVLGQGERGEQLRLLVQEQVPSRCRRNADGLLAR